MIILGVYSFSRIMYMVLVYGILGDKMKKKFDGESGLKKGEELEWMSFELNKLKSIIE